MAGGFRFSISLEGPRAGGDAIAGVDAVLRRDTGSGRFAGAWVAAGWSFVSRTRSACGSCETSDPGYVHAVLQRAAGKCLHRGISQGESRERSSEAVFLHSREGWVEERALEAASLLFAQDSSGGGHSLAISRPSAKRRSSHETARLAPR